MKRGLFVLVLAALAGLALGQGAMVRVAHLSPDAPAVDVVQVLKDTGADVLVHEACRATRLAEAVKGTPFERIFAYHADTIALGAMAERAGVRHLLLTHLIPSPNDERQERSFADDVRSGGWSGEVTVGRDLDTLVVEGDTITLQRAR